MRWESWLSGWKGVQMHRLSICPSLTCWGFWLFGFFSLFSECAGAITLQNFKFWNLIQIRIGVDEGTKRHISACREMSEDNEGCWQSKYLLCHTKIKALASKNNNNNFMRRKSQSYGTRSNFSYPQSSHRQLLFIKNCETVAAVAWFISDISKICIFLNNTRNKSSSIIFIHFLFTVKCQKINQIPVNWSFVDLCMSWTGSVLQELETVCSAVIMSLTTSTIKGIVQSVFITIVNWNAWIKRKALILWAEPDFSEYSEIYLAMENIV